MNIKRVLLEKTLEFRLRQCFPDENERKAAENIISAVALRTYGVSQEKILQYFNKILQKENNLTFKKFQLLSEFIRYNLEPDIFEFVLKIFSKPDCTEQKMLELQKWIANYVKNKSSENDTKDTENTERTINRARVRKLNI